MLLTRSWSIREPGALSYVSNQLAIHWGSCKMVWCESVHWAGMRGWSSAKERLCVCEYIWLKVVEFLVSTLIVTWSEVIHMLLCHGIVTISGHSSLCVSKTYAMRSFLFVCIFNLLKREAFFVKKPIITQSEMWSPDSSTKIGSTLSLSQRDCLELRALMPISFIQYANFVHKNESQREKSSRKGGCTRLNSWYGCGKPVRQMSWKEMQSTRSQYLASQLPQTSRVFFNHCAHTRTHAAHDEASSWYNVHKRVNTHTHTQYNTVILCELLWVAFEYKPMSEQTL